MNARTGLGKAASFAAAAGSIGIAALLARACPGSCTSCASCVTSIAPMGAAAGAVGAALFGSVVVRSRADRRAGTHGDRTASGGDAG